SSGCLAAKVGAAHSPLPQSRSSLLRRDGEDACAACLGGDRGVIAAPAVARARAAAARVRRAGVVLVVAVDDRRQPGGRASRAAEVVEQVSVAGTSDAALA